MNKSSLSLIAKPCIFFETQRNRIHDLIIEIEATAISSGVKTELEAKRQDARSRLDVIGEIRASA